MKTEKLVLSACVVVAVTGAHQVFGDTGADPLVAGKPSWVAPRKAVIAAEPQAAAPQELDLFEQQILSSDGFRQDRDASSIEIMKQRLADETAELADSGAQEVDCMELALWLEHRAFLLNNLLSGDYTELLRKAESIKGAIKAAEEACESAKSRRQSGELTRFNAFCTRMSYAKEIRRLNRELEKLNVLMNERAEYDRLIAAKYLGAAKENREGAFCLRTRRYQLSDVLHKRAGDDALSKRARLVYIAGKIGTAEIREQELEDLRLESIRNIIALHEARRRYEQEEKIAEDIRYVFRSHADVDNLPFYMMPGEDLGLCKVHSSYPQRPYDFLNFEPQKYLLECACKGIAGMEAPAREALEKIWASKAALRTAVPTTNCADSGSV